MANLKVTFRYHEEHSSRPSCCFFMPRADFSPSRLIHKLLDNGAELVRHPAVYCRWYEELHLLNPDYNLEDDTVSLDLVLSEATAPSPWIASIIQGNLETAPWPFSIYLCGDLMCCLYSRETGQENRSIASQRYLLFDYGSLASALISPQNPTSLLDPYH